MVTVFPPLASGFSHPLAVVARYKETSRSQTVPFDWIRRAAAEIYKPFISMPIGFFKNLMCLPATWEDSA
jgi:hypothetical protein